MSDLIGGCGQEKGALVSTGRAGGEGSSHIVILRYLPSQTQQDVKEQGELDTGNDAREEGQVILPLTARGSAPLSRPA